MEQLGDAGDTGILVRLLFERKTVLTREDPNGRALVQDPNGLSHFDKPADPLIKRSKASRDGVLELRCE